MYYIYNSGNNYKIIITSIYIVLAPIFFFFTLLWNHYTSVDKKKGLLSIPVIIGRKRFEHAMKTLRSQQERRENVVESLRTRYKRPQIASSRSENAVQWLHDRRAIAMIAVQTPTYFFFS
jgi:hypothetical protein